MLPSSRNAPRPRRAEWRPATARHARLILPLCPDENHRAGFGSPALMGPGRVLRRSPAWVRSAIVGSATSASVAAWSRHNLPSQSRPGRKTRGIRSGIDYILPVRQRPAVPGLFAANAGRYRAGSNGQPGGQGPAAEWPSLSAAEAQPPTLRIGFSQQSTGEDSGLSSRSGCGRRPVIGIPTDCQRKPLVPDGLPDRHEWR
jgi:hypothetical protein